MILIACSNVTWKTKEGTHQRDQSYTLGEAGGLPVKGIWLLAALFCDIFMVCVEFLCCVIRKYFWEARSVVTSRTSAQPIISSIFVLLLSIFTYHLCVVRIGIVKNRNWSLSNLIFSLGLSFLQPRRLSVGQPKPNVQWTMSPWDGKRDSSKL